MKAYNEVKDAYVGIKASCRRAHKWWDFKRLESKIADYSLRAQGHEEKGVPHGSPEFVHLAKTVAEAVFQYCYEYGVERSEVTALIPNIRFLCGLAKPDTPKAPDKAKAVWGLLLALASAIIVGGWLGLAHWAFHWFVR